MYKTMRKTVLGLTAAVLLLLPVKTGNACTNILITRGASTDNSNMVSYAADSHMLYGELYFHPAVEIRDLV